MNSNSIILLTLSFGVTVGVPLYILFRDKMGKELANNLNFSRRRVFKLTAINLTLNSLIGLVLLGMFLNLLILFNSFSIYHIALALLFFVSAGTTFYGNGIYITSIILEAYTLPQLQRIKEFKTQFIATHLFHGPISHVLIYSGWPIAMFFLSLLELTSLQDTNFPGGLLIIGGMATAIAYSVGQIYNHTYLYHLVTNSVLGIILSISFLIAKDLGPIYIYSLAFTVTSGIVLWIYSVRDNYSSARRPQV